LELHTIGKLTTAYPLLNATYYAKVEARIEKLKSQFANYFGQYDVLMCSVNPMTATGMAYRRVARLAGG